MNPICKVPGCNTEAAGQLSIIHYGMDGAMSLALCPLHVGTFVNGLTGLLEAMRVSE